MAQQEAFSILWSMCLGIGNRLHLYCWMGDLKHESKREDTTYTNYTRGKQLYPSNQRTGVVCIEAENYTTDWHQK